MTEEQKRELVIIGAGPGGYAAAFRAADLGVKVTLVDPEANPGGVCLYRGCIPSKALLHVTGTRQEAAKVGNRGLEFKDPEMDPEKTNDWKNSIITKLTRGLGQLAGSRDIEYIQGKAKFKSSNTLEIKPEDDEAFDLVFGKAVIATGSVPLSLPGVKTDHKNILDSRDALEINEIPEEMLVVGGGYIGLELGSMYAVLGCRVSIAEMASGFLPGTDRDLVEVFEKENENLFKAVYFNTRVEHVETGKEKLQVSLTNDEGTQEKQYDKVLVAIGRKPDTESLGLKNAGIETDKNGFIKVDPRRQTNIPGIFAIGDLTGEPFLAHKATYEGKIAAEVIAGEPGAVYDPRSIAGIVFTNPEIAWCGLTEHMAEENDISFKAGKYPWTASGHAVMMETGQGLTKLLFHPETGRILGGGVAGKNAGSLIPEISFAIEMGATAGELVSVIRPHPTLSETIMEAAGLFFDSTTHVLSEKKNKSD